MLATLGECWQRVEPPEHGYRVQPEQAEAVARQVLDAMLTRPFRVGKSPTEDEYSQLLARVRHWVARGRSIRIKIGYAPMKNPNAVRSSRADWSEFFALCHLCQWHHKVRAIYPPGLRIKIIFDDATILMANRADPGPMDSYISSMRQLIAAMGYQSLIVGVMRQSWFAWLFHFGPYQLAERRVLHWERDAANRPLIEKMDEGARRNLALPAGLPPEEQERRWREASHRYRVYWEALQLSGLPRLGKSLIGMYLDGTQHHIRQQAAFHLTSVGKGQVTQPWQGEGVLWDNGKGLLVPIVLTAGRRQRMAIKEIRHLNFLRLPGFDTIATCREIDPGGETEH
ncbi:MAG: L-tyrosine/L-tryptophan isonitrile synthase family protein [Thermoguttaceae bacterium]